MFGIDQNSIFLLGILVLLAFFGFKYLSIVEKSKYNTYKLERKKLNLKKGKKAKQSENDDDEVEDFIESLPGWLKGIADGAGIDLEAVYYGDQDEISKVGQLIEKNIKGGNGNDKEGGYI